MPSSPPRVRNLPRIAFFLSCGDGPGSATNDNHTRLPGAFAALGWDVVAVRHESLRLAGGRLVADTAGGQVELAAFDAYFVLGFGAKATFLDRMQLLRGLDQSRFVNTVDALVYQHGKASLQLDCPDVPQPATHVANNPATLAAVVAQGGEWIAKPPAGSFGRDVFRLRRGDANVRVILEHLTRDGGYALLQERIDVGEAGERRVLLAAGEIVGAYGKRPADHRANLDVGARAFRCALTVPEQATVSRLAARLDALGVRFAAVDLAAGHVLEINVANPGGLRTCATVYGGDPTPRAAAALAGWLNARRRKDPRPRDPRPRAA